MLFKVLVREMVDKAVMASKRMVCEYWVDTVLIDKCWSTLECGRMLQEILEGGDNLREGVEAVLRDIREVKEAEPAMMLEEELMLKRREKVERQRLAWRKRMEHQKYERMLKELSNLSLEDLDKNMMTIERFETMMMIDEAGADTGKHNIISMDDMCEAAKHKPNKPIITWADELMDTVTKDTEGSMHGVYMMQGDSMMNNFAQGDMKKDTLPEGLEMMPQGEGGMEVALSRNMGNKPDELESVVGVERLNHYPHH
jgi:hypothetical protein